VKAPADVDPDMRTVLEIIQHCGEILSRLPLHVLRSHLEELSVQDAWTERAIESARAAAAFELANAQLSAEEARILPALKLDSIYPDDALPSSSSG
jgi:hypothetical protein